MATRRTRTFEWALLLIVIAGVLIAAANFYGRLAGDVQRLSFELAAQHFQTAVSGVRAQWYVQRSRNEPDSDVVVFSELPGVPGSEGPADPVRVYLNPQGWPVNTDSRADAQSGQLTSEHCLQLWRALLQEPPEASLAAEPPASARYQVSLEEAGHCRYRHLVDATGGQYFDYQPETGRVEVRSSDK